MIRFSQRGDFKKITGFLEKAKETVKMGDLNKYGREGVEALRKATPKDSGYTASCWEYRIEHDKAGSSIVFYNTNIADDWAPIAILIQYGHATGTGGFVKGRDYINPAIQPIFDRIAQEAWKEVTR